MKDNSIIEELVKKYYNEAYITNKIKKMSLFVLKTWQWLIIMLWWIKQMIKGRKIYVVKLRKR